MAAPPSDRPAGEAALDALRRIEHVVVLMLENRSFDHMLGHLALAGRRGVDGLRLSMENSWNGKSYPVHHLGSTRLGPSQDPCHTGACVDEQVAGDMQGFVASYAGAHPADPDPGIVMGYYDDGDLPSYAHLAARYAICDRWFCSTPGATWPNRLYAACGRADGSRDVRDPPIYDVPSFVRHLDAAHVSWRWYAHDVATLRLIDGHYRLDPGHFAYVDRRSLLAPRSFLDDAASGDLAAVSWLDPNFVDLRFIGPSGSNDDHPPSDVLDGQELVFKVYHAIATSPAWATTMLVVVYDEHGGFFDHVEPPAAPDDAPAFRRYGPRVPALVVSPFTEPGAVSHVTYDHTSILRTILLRFCRGAGGAVPSMGARTDAANHLGALLTRSTARPAPTQAELQPLIDRFAQRHARLFSERLQQPLAGTAPSPTELNELQQGIVSAREELRKQGLPEDLP